MILFNKKKHFKAQAAIEYLLLLGAVMALVLIGLKKYLPRTNVAAEAYYNAVVNGLNNNPNVPLCGNGVQDPFENEANCCIDFGSCSPIPPPP